MDGAAPTLRYFQFVDAPLMRRNDAAHLRLATIAFWASFLR
jgi:hypothetical protein